MPSHPSGRAYVRSYEGLRRRPYHEFIEGAVARAGGRVLWSSPPDVEPFYLALEDPNGARLGLMIYVFYANRKRTRNRPQDEHRMQLRYGDVNSEAWRAQHHPVGIDPAGVDVTLVLGVQLEAQLLVALDPLLYDPLPLGISVFFKDADIARASRESWHVWTRDNITGARRESRSAQLGLETLVAFTPDRLFDFVALERQAQALRFEPPLRYRAALHAAAPQVDRSRTHQLERELALSSSEILELIAERSRLATAVRGGVAERHLGKLLAADPLVKQAELGQNDGPPDFVVTLADGRRVTVEVKNASPSLYADGTPKVEVQKTRASQRDRSSRWYEPSAFDVLAACMYGPTGAWTFRYKRSISLVEHKDAPGRINPLQRIDHSWAKSLHQALEP